MTLDNHEQPDLRRSGIQRLSWKRVSVAAAMVAIFTTSSFLMAGNGFRPIELHELLLLPLLWIVYGWPAVLMFLAFGLPTLYWLVRVDRLSLAWFVVAGAIYTALPWIILQLVFHPARARFLQMSPSFALIGIGNGGNTWLVVVNRKQKRLHHSDLR